MSNRPLPTNDQQTASRVRTIGVDELHTKLGRHDDFVFVMAMDERRFETAHIAGSMSYDAFEADLPNLPRSAEVVLYCTNAACVASKIRATMLVEAGFSNVARFAGGLADWTAAGLPVRSGQPLSV